MPGLGMLSAPGIAGRASARGTLIEIRMVDAVARVASGFPAALAAGPLDDRLAPSLLGVTQ